MHLMKYNLFVSFYKLRVIFKFPINLICLFFFKVEGDIQFSRHSRNRKRHCCKMIIIFVMFLENKTCIKRKELSFLNLNGGIHLF